MKLSLKGEKLIEKFEALRLKAYRDGAGVWTIGYGHTAGVHAGMVITETQADILLMGDTSKAQASVNALVKVPLTQNQFDALVSLTFNLGASPLLGSVGRALKAKNYAAAANAMLAYNKARNPHTGRLEVEGGLVTRRAKERALFLSA